MTSEKIPTPASGDVTWVLDEFIQRVPGAESAVLASQDGLQRARSGSPDPDWVDKMSALMAGLMSLARSVCLLKGTEGEVMQNVIQTTAGTLFVVNAGQGSNLAVLAGPEADSNIIGYEMALLVKSVSEHLGTPVRHSEASASDPAR